MPKFSQPVKNAVLKLCNREKKTIFSHPVHIDLTDFLYSYTLSENKLNAIGCKDFNYTGGSIPIFEFFTDNPSENIWDILTKIFITR